MKSNKITTSTSNSNLVSGNTTSNNSHGVLSPSSSSSSMNQNSSSTATSTSGSHKDDLEEKYSDSSLYPCPGKFDKIVPLEERYITHSTFLKNKSSETTFIVLLTNHRMYKIDPDSLKRIWTIDLLDIHSVEGDESTDPKTLKIVYHIRQSPTSLVSGIIGGSNSPNNHNHHQHHHHHHHPPNALNDRNIPQELSPPDSPTFHSRISQLTSQVSKKTSESYISEKVIIAESEEIRDQWLISLKFLTRQLFQKYFESNFIASPSIYQLHLFVYKTNRKGKNQIRCIVLSTERLYNISVKSQSLEIGKIKWSFPISALKSLTVSKNPNNILILHLDNKENSKVKEMQQFILKDQLERNLLVNEIRRIFEKCTKQSLLKEEKDEVIKSRSKSKLNLLG